MKTTGLTKLRRLELISIVENNDLESERILRKTRCDYNDQIKNLSQILVRTSKHRDSLLRDINYIHSVILKYKNRNLLHKILNLCGFLIELNSLIIKLITT